MPEQRFEPAGLFVHRIEWNDGREATFEPTTPGWVLEDTLSFFHFVDDCSAVVKRHIPLADVRHWEAREMQRLVPADGAGA